MIILDEAQALPAGLLGPILDSLRQLSKHYGSSIVLSTATQPAFEIIREFREIRATRSFTITDVLGPARLQAATAQIAAVAAAGALVQELHRCQLHFVPHAGQRSGYHNGLRLACGSLRDGSAIASCLLLGRRRLAP